MKPCISRKQIPCSIAFLILSKLIYLDKPVMQKNAVKQGFPFLEII